MASRLCLSTEEEVNAAILEHELATGTRYAASSSTKDFGKWDAWIPGKSFKILWEGRMPFINQGRKRIMCHLGKNHNRKRARRNEILRMKQLEASQGKDVKSRVIIKPTKKLDCPALIDIREVALFPKFEASDDSQATKENQKKRLRMAIQHGSAVWKKAFLFTLPGKDEHQNHPVGLEGGALEHADKRLIQKIYEICSQGITDTHTVKKMLHEYALTICPDVTSIYNKRFFPDGKIVRNHIKRYAKIKEEKEIEHDHQDDDVGDDDTGAGYSGGESFHDDDGNEVIKTHPSVRIKGTEANYQPEQCFDASCIDRAPHMHCPFCVKSEYYTDPTILKAHYRVKHVDKGIEFAGLKVLRCCSNCEIVGVIKGEKRFKGAHWHCYKCKNGFNRRDEAIKHYKTHFRNPQTTFQIQITQDINQPVSVGFENEEAAASIPTEGFSIHSIHSGSVNLHDTLSPYTHSSDMSMTHRGLDGMVTGVGAIETVGLNDTQTIMIIQDESGHIPALSDSQQETVSTSPTYIHATPTIDSTSELRIQQLQDKVSELERQAAIREMKIQALEAKVASYKAREKELLEQMALPNDKTIQDMCKTLENQHKELIRQQLKHVHNTLRLTSNQSTPTTTTKMIILNPMTQSIPQGTSLLNSGLGHALNFHSPQTVSVNISTRNAEESNLIATMNQEHGTDIVESAIQSNSINEATDGIEQDDGTEKVEHLHGKHVTFDDGDRVSDHSYDESIEVHLQTEFKQDHDETVVEEVVEPVRKKPRTRLIRKEVANQ
ncbi:uncharacterized protein LOC128232801 [Mya arenaria]|uniref:uncharacterized protein LOC128232801 n=1 Tax=Mya arenaria TaxID=6604 RepID=UPI0022E7B8A6|nr:uncharacterized protein LOC128232801 [Mya arenaria]